MKTTGLFVLLLLLLSCHQSDPRKDEHHGPAADSLIRYLNAGIEGYYYRDQYDSMRMFLDTALQPVLANGNDSLLSVYWGTRGMTFLYTEKMHDSALFYFRRALDYAYRSDSVNEGVVAALSYISTYYIAHPGFDSAMHYAAEAYQLSQHMRPHIKWRMARALAASYYMSKDLDNTIKYCREALQWAETDDEFASTYANIGVCFGEINRKDSAELYMGIAKMYAQQSAAQANWHSSAVAGVVHSLKGEHEKALSTLLVGLEKAKLIHVQRSGHYTAIANVYYRLGKFEQSFQYMDSAIGLAKQQGDLQRVINGYHVLRGIQHKTGQSHASYATTDSLLSYINIVDSIDLLNKTRDIEARYQVKAKDAAIKNLAAQRQVILISIGSGVLLLILIGVMIFRKRQSQMIIQQYSLHQQLLRATMQPHFISNALSNLQAFIRGNRKDEAIRYLGAFAKLTEVSLLNSRENFVPVSSEVEALKSYLSLQATHHDGRFTYSVDAYEDYEVDTIKIPPMLLQPFVENAIVHGVSTMDGGGVVTIKIERGEDTLRCTIHDNGAGFQHATSKDRPSLSMEITEQRLQIISKQTRRKARLTVIDHTQQGKAGVTVELIIPFMQGRMARSSVPHADNALS